MLYYILLLAVLLCLTVVAFLVGGKELLAPITIMPAMFSVVTVLAMIGMFTWNTVQLKSDGFFIISLGCSVFVIGGIIVQRLPYSSVGASNRGDNDAQDVFEWKQGIATWKWIVLIVLLLVALGLFVADTYRLGRAMGITDSNYLVIAKQVHHQYATYYSTSNVRVGEGYSVITKQFEKLAIVSGFIGAGMLTIGVKSHPTKKTFVRNVLLPTIVLVLSCTFILSGGYRSWVMRFAMAALIVSFIVDCMRTDNAAKVSLRYALVLIPLGIIAFALFYLSGVVLGRAGSHGIIEYISFYFGAGIPTLQTGISGDVKIDAPGSLTFYGISLLLYKVGIIDYLPGYSAFWVNLGGHSSNVPTCFFRYFYDFGYAGVLIFGLLQGIVFCGLYLLVKKYKSTTLLLLFSLIYAYLIDLVREEFIFSRMISSNMILNLILLVALSYWLTNPVMKQLISRCKMVIERHSSRNSE
ncbi:oligosaccharide repeat unit polymerase [Bifidobacterium sp. LC6]|uniref:Oligosaccharide repeat unit polymerase n=1 Tax=Bifidobacterium colobi TaxID=2809026 RepID=A0ABS5UX90_9BIFI|nr:O-antigen polymerase [Bifidobacterium colobi]MBT1175734.1 oligosaccharide repeat unit polymerase [Bifidobacterium colobi]